MKSLYTLTICLFLSISCYGNNSKIDSLKTELAKVKLDTTKVNIYNEIAVQFIDVSYDSILPYSQKALNLSKKIKFPKGKGIALKNQSIYYFFAGNQAESRKKIEEAILVFKEIENDHLLGEAYQRYGLLLKNYGNTNEAIDKYQTAIGYFEKINDQNSIADNLINLGNVYQNQGEFDKALAVYSDAKEVNKELEDLGIRASILTGEGVIAENKGNFNIAVQKLSESLELFKALGETRLVLGMYNNLANVSRKQGNYLVAIEYFENALSTAKEMNNPRLQGIILNNLANAYLDLDDDDKAASLYKEAIGVIKDVDRTTYANLLANLAIIQTNQKQYHTALQSLDSSLTIYREQGNKIYIANALSNIAYNHLKLENLSEAKNFYKEGKFIAEEMDDKYTCTSIYNGLGEVSLKENKLDSAYFYAEKALAISREIEALPEEYSAAELLYNISKSEGNDSEALNYLEIFTKLKDSLFDEEKSKALGKLEAELSFKSLKEQMELETQKQNLENKYKVDQREDFIIGLSISSLALILFVVLLLYIRKNKTKTNRLLHLKNKEIETQNIKLNESNLQKNKLFSIISHDLRSPVNSLSQIFDMYVSGQISEEEFKDWLPEINKNLTSTRHLIDNLLKWASESLNESQVEKTVIPLQQEVESMKEFFSSSLKNKNITLKNKVPEDLEIYMDSNALKLVIRNLISNAIKFCNPEDEISVSALRQGGYDRICIQDTGVGMKQDQARRLFNNSSIISSVGTQKEEGKGIGTVLCRTFVEENGGTIWVDYSEEHLGTRICFEVPVKE
ncbi:tetratricopeptide repeat protein [Psychroflexus salinarum]|uniref:histidine kinase n=1 Tax=Psychroflexus salinarum TaxID=546024 RepID=A0ABW3GT95_9FLAO